jgi:alpha-1,6-mannosyltransferase
VLRDAATSIDLADQPTRAPWSLALRYGLVAGAVIADVGLLRAPYGSAADRTAPLAVIGCVTVVALALLEHRRPHLPRRFVLGVACALLALAVLVPPRTSHDLWSYAMYGRIVTVHDADPYTTPPDAFRHDPMLHRVSHGWRDTPSVYGPAFTTGSAVIAKVVGSNPLATRLAYQAWAAGSVLAILLILHKRRLTAAVIALGLHPIVVVALVNGGHNDALVGLLLVAAVLAVERRWPKTAGAAAAGAALIKIAAILPAGALVLWLWRREGSRAATRAGATCAAVLAGGYLVAGGPSALHPVLNAAGHLSRVSFWPRIHSWPLHGHEELFMLAMLVALPAMIGSLARLRAHPAAAAAAATAPFLLAAPYVLPWYFAWALPLVALADDGLLALVLLIDTSLVVIAYTGKHLRHPDLLDRLVHGEVLLTQDFELTALAAIVVAAVVSYVVLFMKQHRIEQT